MGKFEDYIAKACYTLIQQEKWLDAGTIELTNGKIFRYKIQQLKSHKKYSHRKVTN